MNKIKALKRYGQNFLIDNQVINKIVNLVEPQSPNQVIEIGPGDGALTRGLINNFEKYSGIEIDPRLIEKLEIEFPGISLIKKDIIKVNLEELILPENYTYIFGNIPYNISTPIMYKLIKNFNLIDKAVIMVQLETAQRVTSPFGTKNYNASNVIFNFFADIKIHFEVPRNAFIPRPHVDSAVMSLTFKKNKTDAHIFEVFSDIVKTAFLTRRKVLKNSTLNKKYGFFNFENLDKFMMKRADELTPEDYFTITQTISGK